MRREICGKQYFFMLTSVCFLTKSFFVFFSLLSPKLLNGSCDPVYWTHGIIVEELCKE